MKKKTSVADALLNPFRNHADILADRVESGIETNRKGYATIKVIDDSGAGVPGAVVTATQKTHDFKYGANIFMLDEFESNEKNQLYRQMFKEYFNLATLPFYWDTLEPEEGKPRFSADSPKVYRRPAPDLCLDYCEEYGITPKAHCLNYDHFSPAWLQKYPAEKQWLLYEKRVAECAERYKMRIPGWEVTNELFWSYGTSKMYYDPMFMEKSFSIARRYFPANELISNEGQEPFRQNFLFNRNMQFMQVERAIARGASIDTIGLQYHLWSNLDDVGYFANIQFNPNQIYRVLDTFWETFHRPMQITEITLPCFDPFSRENEEAQAEALKNLYSIFFSHPALEAVIYWNLVDGYAFNAKPGDFTAGENYLAGGLAHFDLSPKPALTTLKHLFNDVWITRKQLVTDETGQASFKGFYGEYELDIRIGDKQITRNIHLEKYPVAPLDREITVAV